jgi:DNA (cytosine-5)-methyltransferase 1
VALRIGELFAGIGGLGIAAEWTFGGSVAWQADRVGEKVRQRHFPEAVQIVGDVARVDPRSLEPVDVLCAGFACQDLSFAGAKRSAKDLHAGDRTGPTYRETLRFVRALRPQYVVLENVPALLNHRAVLERDLVGYGLTWVLCGACDAGAPHRRMRVFILAELDGIGRGIVEAPSDRAWSPVENTRTWSTPTAGNFNEHESAEVWYARRARIREEKKNGNGMGEPLCMQVRMWGTPRVGGGGSGRAREDDAGRLENQVGGARSQRLNPAWVEPLMGYPIGWTSPEGDRLTPDPTPRWPRGRYPKGWDRSQPWQGFSWEPPRTLPDGPAIPGRPVQLRALGNAVSPQQGHLALTTARRPKQLDMWG